MKKYVVLLIFLTGCMVGPNYKKPATEMPGRYAEDASVAMTSLRAWWERFNSPILNGLVDSAISANYDLQIALEKIETTRAFYRLKRADLFPEVDVKASAVRWGMSSHLIETSFFPVSTLNTYLAGFDAVWELDIFGKLRREKEAAWYEMQAAWESMRDVYVTVTSDVARGYADICALNRLIALTREKIEAQKNILAFIESRYDTGLDSDIPKEQQVAILQDNEAVLLYYSTLLKDTTYRIAVLLGKQPEEIGALLDGSREMLSAEEQISPGLPSELLRRRPDVRYAERSLARATARVGAAIAEYFPSFSLTGRPGWTSNRWNNLFTSGSLTWTIGGLMNWPLITFGRIRANVDVKKSEQRQALLQYENTVLLALKDVESALAAYFNQEDKLKKVGVELDAIEKKTALEEEKFESGLIDGQFYLEQKKQLLDTKIKLVETRRILALDLISVYKALGGGDWD